MATVEGTLVIATREGVDVGFESASATGVDNGNTWANDGEDVYVIVKAGATPTTPTFRMVDVVDGEVIADSTDGKVATACAANTQRIYGPFPNSPYGDVDSMVEIIWSSVTDIEYALIKAGSLSLVNV